MKRPPVFQQIVAPSAEQVRRKGRNRALLDTIADVGLGKDAET